MKLRAIFVLALSLPALNAADAIVAPPRVGLGGTQRHLTLEQAIELAIGANLDVQIERTNIAAADQEIRAARGSFDPVFRWQPNFGDSNTPAESLLQGAAGITTQHSAGQTFAFHQQTARSGLTLDAQFDSSRITSANPFVSLSPFYVSQLTLGVTQPLMRGRAIDSNRALVKIRVHNRNASCSELDVRALDVAARVEEAYWDLVAARRQVDVAVEAANLAQTQLEQVRRKIQAGTMATVELSEPQAELERRLDDVYRGTSAVSSIENSLKTLLARNRGDNLWADEIIPEDAGVAPPPEIIEPRQSLEAALRRRPELKELDSNLAANEVENRRNADLVKPQMNLAVNYSLAGLAGTVKPGADPFTSVASALYARVDQLSTSAGLAVLANPQTGALPGSVVGGYGSSLSNLFGGKYQSVTAGITFEFTVHNRAAEAGLAGSAIARKRLELLRARAEQAITAQVRDALQAVESGRQRINAAAAGERAAQDKLGSETRLFAAGESTSFLVLTRQNEYSDARRRRVEADTAFNKAVAQYESALGMTLDSRGISSDCGK